jgi:hypothetical protein
MMRRKKKLCCDQSTGHVIFSCVVRKETLAEWRPEFGSLIGKKSNKTAILPKSLSQNMLGIGYGYNVGTRSCVIRETVFFPPTFRSGGAGMSCCSHTKLIALCK